jgi:protein-disulfide isomerase
MTQEAKVLTGIGIVTLIIVIVAVFFFGGKSQEKETEKITTEQTKQLVRKDSHKQEAKGAKVTIVEFGDFQCPACGAAYPIVEQIKKEYKGKVTFVFRQYPLPAHQNGHAAAEAAEAAGAQGKFFDMYNALYQNQKDWGESKNAMDYFKKYAQAMDLDMDKFVADVEGKKYAEKIQKDQNDGNAVGISATPTFFINDEMIVGGLPYDQFKQKIDAALKQ